MNRTQFTYLFIFICLVEIIAATMGINWLVYLSKPMIMLSIIAYYYSETKYNFDWQNKIMLIAFMFSLLGDVFLMFSQELFFIFGLGAFLLTHLCLIFVFGIKYKINIVARVCFLLYAIAFVALLRKYIPDALFLPVLIYGFTLATMGIRAAERQATQPSYRKVFVGALFFVLSDSLLALNKFVLMLPLSTFLIISSYALAQYYICMGMIDNK